YLAERIATSVVGETQPARRALRRTRYRGPSYRSTAGTGAGGSVRFRWEQGINISVRSAECPAGVPPILVENFGIRRDYPHSPLRSMFTRGRTYYRAWRCSSH